MSSVLLFLTKGTCAAYMGLHCQALPYINGSGGGKQREGGRESLYLGNREAERRGPVRLRVTLCWTQSHRQL